MNGETRDIDIKVAKTSCKALKTNLIRKETLIENLSSENLVALATYELERKRNH